MPRAASVPAHLKAAPVFLDMKREYSRAARRDAPDYYNMLIEQGGVDNNLDPQRWKGHGFQGHIQYITYLGKELS